jgi:hypothetical protein
MKAEPTKWGTSTIGVLPNTMKAGGDGAATCQIIFSLNNMSLSTRESPYAAAGFILQVVPHESTGTGTVELNRDDPENYGKPAAETPGQCKRTGTVTVSIK